MVSQQLVSCKDCKEILVVWLSRDLLKTVFLFIFEKEKQVHALNIK